MTNGSEQRTLRVLAADDSAVMRSVFRTVFQLHAATVDSPLPRMELCGVAENGAECLQAVTRLRPDVLLLDFEMPVMNGLEVLARLRVQAPWLPVIMCSAYTERGGRATLEALGRGAKDYVMKPGQQSDFAAALDALMEQLLPKIAALATAGRPHGLALVKHPAEKPEQIAAEKPMVRRGTLFPASTADATGRRLRSTPRIEAVVIAVSTGGPSALEIMLPMLPAELPVPVLIVQHMPRLFTGVLAKRLDRLCTLRVAEAEMNQRILPGTVYLAPGDAHMEVAAGARELRGPVVHLHHGAPLNSCMPSADYLFRSALRTYGVGTLGVVMTGMGADGVEGAREVSGAGGVVLAQDEATSAVWGMPGRVSRAGVALATLPLKEIAGEIVKLVALGREVASVADRTDISHFGPGKELYGVL